MPRYFQNDNGILIKLTGNQSYERLYMALSKDGPQMVHQSSKIETDSDITPFFENGDWDEIDAAEFKRQKQTQIATKKEPASGKPVEFAFMHDGIPFYQFSSIWDMPIGRGHEAEVVFWEMECRADRDYLAQAFKKILDSTNGEDIRIGDIAVIASDALHRMSLTVDFSIYEKLASILYFDDGENIARYDFEYNKKKLQRWRRSGRDFFLHMPLSNWIPSEVRSDPNFQTNLRKDEIMIQLIKSRLDQLSKNT